MCDCTQQDRLPASVDLYVYRGATFSQQFTWSSRADSSSPAVPVDLTGFTGDMQVVAADDTVAISLTTTNGRLTLGGVAGTITMSISATDTATLADATYRYSLLLTSGATVTALLTGSVIVSG